MSLVISDSTDPVTKISSTYIKTNILTVSVCRVNNEQSLTDSWKPNSTSCYDNLWNQALKACLKP